PAKIDIFSPWVEAEKKHGFRSTFFFFASKISKRHVRDNVYRWEDLTWYRGSECRIADLVRDLDETGWEIGLHGSFNTAHDAEMMLEQKLDIEQFLKTPMISTRQHNLHFDSQETPQIMEKVGFAVDSTLGFNRDIGFRAGTSYPFHLWDASTNRWMKLLEIPLILHDCALLRKDNLDLDVESAFALCKKIIDQVAEMRGVVTLLWHPESYIKPYWFELYTRLLDYIDSQNGWGASAAQIYRWWTTQGLDTQLHQTVSNLQKTP
ncbi:MAG: polysaccharide deacetylase family protein, partial [Chthoniobacterales bacterium]